MAQIEDLVEKEDQVEEIFREELKKGLLRIKLRETSGSDEIDPEMLKLMEEDGERFLKLCRIVLDNEKILKEWKEKFIIYKKWN